MTWIESHQELGSHPKTKRLARLLDEPVVAVIGRLHCLWWWALDYADDGSLAAMDVADIADACQWDGEPTVLVEAMLRVRFLDQRNDGLHIHDWDDYAGRLIEKRRANIARTQRWRAERATNGQPTNSEAITNARVMHNERVGYDTTVPYPTGPDRTGPPTGTPVDPGTVAGDPPSADGAAAASLTELPERVRLLHEILDGQRGYVPTTAFFRKLTSGFDALDLTAEGIKMTDWLTTTAKGKRQQCSVRFVLNWLGHALKASPPKPPPRQAVGFFTPRVPYSPVGAPRKVKYGIFG